MAEPRGIRNRIVVLVTVGALAPLGALGFLAGSRIARLEAELGEERQRLARTLATRLDDALEAELAALEGIASDATFDSARPGTHDRALLQGVLRRSRLLESAFVARADAAVVVEPEGAVPACAATSAAHAGRVPRLEAASALLCLLAPVDTAGGRVVIGGTIRTGAPALTALLRAGPGPATAALVDGDGGTAVPGPGDDDGMPRAVTTVPLALGGWQLRVSAPAREAASLRARTTTLLVLIVPLVLVFAWGAARSVTRPLATLGQAAGRIARGGIEEPLPDLGGDEVGRLGRTMETMRQALKEALDAAARSNAVLEERVEQRTRELERLNRELKEREQARGRLLRKVITAQEEERKRIARELHDESCQTLSVLVISLDGLRARVGDPDAGQAIAAARDMAVRTLDEVHRLIFDLRPAVLDDLGLPAALEWLAERHLEAAGVAVRLEMAPLDGRLPVEAETAVFRAVQEVLTNVARHAGATSVLLQMGRQGDEAVIEIEDDGRGFDPASVADLAPSGRGLGLLGIRERMELLGGSALVDSSPGHGTRVVLKIPFSPEAAWLPSAS